MSALTGLEPIVSRTLLAGFLAAGIGAAAATVAGQIEPAAAIAAPVVYLIGALVIARNWRRPDAIHGPAGFGLANTITLCRLVGTSWLATFAAAAALGSSTDHAGDPAIGAVTQICAIAVGSLCLILDGVDGRMARRHQQASRFGAGFDMETDAAMLLFLSAAVPLLGVAGWWVLAIGLMRYALIAASWIVPALRLPYSGGYAAKVIAVAQGIALLLALALALIPAIPSVLPDLILAIALAALVWSFGRQVVWQVRFARQIRLSGTVRSASETANPT